MTQGQHYEEPFIYDCVSNLVFSVCSLNITDLFCLMEVFFGSFTPRLLLVNRLQSTFNREHFSRC